MEYVSLWLQQTFDLSAQSATKVIISGITVLALYIIRTIVIRVVIPRIEDVYTRYRFRKLSGYLIFLIGALVLGRVWFRGFQSLATFLGLVSAGIAIALKDPLANLAGWLFIVWRKPLEVGDRIQIGQNAGDVIDIRVFQFTLMEIGNWVDADQSTGRVIHIPNGKVFTEAIANYSKGFKYIWNEIPVLITFESDWKKAREILLDIGTRHAASMGEVAERRLREAARRFMIFYRKLTPTVYLRVEDCGVLLTVRYLCEPRKRRGTEQAIWEDILLAFSEHDDIDFAYPTTRFYDNRTEGKSGSMRPEGPGPPPGKP
ncbi:MAG: mechanosensitive ion channel [bacterium]|jgi:small-conductance mechanosensitive channel